MTRKEKEKLVRQQLAAVAAFARGSSCIPADEMEGIVQSSTEIVLRKSGMRQDGRRNEKVQSDYSQPASSDYEAPKKTAKRTRVSPATSAADTQQKTPLRNHKLLRRLQMIAERQAAASKDLSREPQVHWVGKDGCAVCGRAYGSVHLSGCQGIKFEAEAGVVVAS